MFFNVLIYLLCRNVLLSVLAALRLPASEKSLEKKQPWALSIARRSTLCLTLLFVVYNFI